MYGNKFDLYIQCRVKLLIPRRVIKPSKSKYHFLIFHVITNSLVGPKIAHFRDLCACFMVCIHIHKYIHSYFCVCVQDKVKAFDPKPSDQTIQNICLHFMFHGITTSSFWFQSNLLDYGLIKFNQEMHLNIRSPPNGT